MNISKDAWISCSNLLKIINSFIIRKTEIVCSTYWAREMITNLKLHKVGMVRHICLWYSQLVLKMFCINVRAFLECILCSKLEFIFLRQDGFHICFRNTIPNISFQFHPLNCDQNLFFMHIVDYTLIVMYTGHIGYKHWHI